jgi:hypothetical protein
MRIPPHKGGGLLLTIWKLHIVSCFLLSGYACSDALGPLGGTLGASSHPLGALLVPSWGWGLLGAA